MKQEQGDLPGGSFPFQSNFDDDFVPSKRVATGNPMTKEEKSQWSFGPNDYSRDEEKRKQKLKSNDVKKLKERERREKMADLIDELRVLIPNCGDNGKKLNQSNVMSYAVEYIRSLHAQVVELKQEILFLKGGQGMSADLVRQPQVIITEEQEKGQDGDQPLAVTQKPGKPQAQNSIFMLGDIEDVGPWPLYFQHDNKSLLNCDWLDAKPGLPSNPGPPGGGNFTLDFDLTESASAAQQPQQAGQGALLNAPYNAGASNAPQVPTLQQRQHQQLLHQQQQQLLQQQLQHQALRQQLQQQQLVQLQDQQQFRNSALQNTLQNALQNTIQNTLQSAMQNINILPSMQAQMQGLQYSPTADAATLSMNQQLLSQAMFPALNQPFALPNPAQAQYGLYNQAAIQPPPLPAQYPNANGFPLSTSVSFPSTRSAAL